MADMIRTVHPVGQGTFISEKFIERNGKETIVVYDCGSQNGKSVIEREICNSFEKGTEICAVYISHLDNDHVNGLEFLIKHCRVKKVFLPYLSPKSLFMTMVKYKCETESGETDLCSELVSDLIYYSHERMSEQFATFKNADYSNVFPEIYFVRSNNICVQNIDTENTDIWKYLAFNNENKKTKKKFFELLISEGIPEAFATDINSFSRLWDNLEYRNILKKIYKKLDGGINANSLGIVSYPLTNAYKEPIDHPCLKHKSCIMYSYNKRQDNAGAIYVGDMDLSDTESDFYKTRYKGNQIGLLQLPHHGSKNSYSTRCAENIEAFIACAGYANRYGHPSGFVIDDLLKKRKELHTVTEHPGSRYREHIVIEY